MPPGLLLIGHSRLLLTYFVPVTDGIDQSGYHISARMFNLDGVFYRKTADDLQYVGHIRRWTLDPVYLLNPREIAKAVEHSPGSRASGLQRVRAEALAKELGSLGHGPLRLVCATFSGKSKRL